MGQGNSEFTIGTRLIIILYGLGLVLIGLPQLQERYGSIQRFLRLKPSSFFADIPNLGKKLKSASMTAFSRDDNMSQLISPSENNPKASSSRSNVKREQELDKVSQQDKKKLNKLLEGL